MNKKVLNLLIKVGTLIILLLLIVIPMTSCDAGISANDIYQSILPNLTIFLVHFFSAVILIVISVWLIWKPTKKMFDSRRDYIGTTINEAEKAKKDAYARLLDAEQKRLKSYQEAQTILEDARTESFLHYDDIINKAQVDAEQILAKAKEESIDFKKNLELENEKRIANIVFNVSESLLKEKINHEKNKRFIAEFIEQTEEKENNV